MTNPVLWMAFGAMLAGLIVIAAGLMGGLVARWWRRGQQEDTTAGTAGWELVEW
jgi:hypothetical protein